jgi:hypothetical protein
MAKIEQFSIAPEFDDIIPILEEWTKGTPDGQTSVYSGGNNNQRSKSRQICMAIRMYVNHTKEYYERIKMQSTSEEAKQEYERAWQERRKLCSPLTTTTTTTTTTMKKEITA